MSISMYQASVPPMIHTLSNLRVILKKADAFVEAKKIAPYSGPLRQDNNASSLRG